MNKDNPENLYGFRGSCLTKGPQAVARRLGVLFFIGDSGFGIEGEYLHELKLEEVDSVKSVDLFLLFGGGFFTESDVSVKLRVGKSEVFFVRLSAKTVDRGLFNEFFGETQVASDSFYFGNGEL